MRSNLKFSKRMSNQIVSYPNHLLVRHLVSIWGKTEYFDHINFCPSSQCLASQAVSFAETNC